MKRAIDTLDASEGDPAVKSLLLGLELMNDVSIDVLTTAVNSLGDEVRPTPSLAKQASAAG
ncbi:MAG TPA: hypothetical protein VKB88_12190 [Bryobacteraceae bacterium]|nr:hypothetical protein [Bryobacteraceae bacterium]